MEDMQHIYYGAYCIDLIVKDIGELPWVKVVVELVQATSKSKYIYNHTWILASISMGSY